MVRYTDSTRLVWTRGCHTVVLHGSLSTDLCQGQCEGQGVQVGVGVEGGGEGGQGEGEEGGHQVHQVRHPQQQQQPGHGADRTRAFSRCVFCILCIYL